MANPDVTYETPVTEAGAHHNVVRRPRAADRDPGRYSRRRHIIELSLGIAFPIVMIVLWQAASVNGWIDRFDYPAPTDIVREMRDTFKENPKGNWWTDIRISVERMLWGYGWGVLIGLIGGILMGMSRVVRATFEPTLNALYTVPKLALIGVFLIVFGFDNTPLIVVIGVTVFFFVWIQTQAAMQSVPESYREAARSFGSNKLQMFRHVMLPAALPQIFVGLRVAAGVAVLTLIGAEFVFTPDSKGIGYRINNARQILDPKQAYVGLVVAAFVGVLFTTLIKFIGRVVTPWARDDAIG
ncbi:MAG TPA: ABC transporter permease [Acidimicrobiales bacterium]